MRDIFPANLQVKQYVALVRSSTGACFRVFNTGDPKYYLFDLQDEHGCSSTIQVPVLKSNLRNDLRRALSHGFGNTVDARSFRMGSAPQLEIGQ